jgi:general stress protein 26
MGISKKDLFKKIANISDLTRFAVLATENNGYPYANLVGFLLSKDLKNLYFFTSQNTRKLKNIKNNANVCLLLDTRDRYPDKTSLITAITITGKANVIKKPSRPIVEKYLAKNAELEEFTKTTHNVLVKVDVTNYVLVNRFKEVIEMKI